MDGNTVVIIVKKSYNMHWEFRPDHAKVHVSVVVPFIDLVVTININCVYTVAYDSKFILK